MPTPVTFQRLYRHAAGPVHEATADRVANVLRSMNEHKDSEAPFKVALRMDDGTQVTVAPKGWRA